MLGSGLATCSISREVYPTGVAASGALAAVAAEAAEAEAAEVAEAAEAAEAAEDWRGGGVPERRAARAAEAKETEPPLALALGLPSAVVATLRASVALALHRGAAAAPLRATAPSGLGTIIALRAAAPTGERRGGSV